MLPEGFDQLLQNSQQAWEAAYCDVPSITIPSTGQREPQASRKPADRKPSELGTIDWLYPHRGIDFPEAKTLFPTLASGTSISDAISLGDCGRDFCKKNIKSQLYWSIDCHGRKIPQSRRYLLSISPRTESLRSPRTRPSPLRSYTPPSLLRQTQVYPNLYAQQNRGSAFTSLHLQTPSILAGSFSALSSCRRELLPYLRTGSGPHYICDWSPEACSTTSAKSATSQHCYSEITR
jgi:hypothetical protein